MESWLDELSVSKSTMEIVHSAIDKLRTLRFEADEAQTRADAKLKAYNDFVVECSQLLRNNGIEKLCCEDGAEIEVVEKARCSIKKDAQSQKEVAQWLRDNGMDNIVKAQLIVMPSQAEKLKQMGVPYDETVDMNTNSVKAYIKGEIEKGTMAEADIPKGISWFMYDDIKISV